MMFNKNNMKYFQYYNPTQQPSLANQRPIITDELSPNNTGIKNNNNSCPINDNIDASYADNNDSISNTDADSDSEEISLKWIIENCPPTKYVREYLKTQLECIQDNDEFNVKK